jgi:lipopolysaccharide transport system permease protein
MIPAEGEEEWSLLIEPKRRWLDLNIREVIRYRDLVWLFVKRDFVTVYKQTVLGPLWFIIQPLITTIMFTFVFGNLAKIGTGGVPYLLFYYGGTMLWTYFESCGKSASDTFTSNSSLFGKVYFPRITVPLSKIFGNMITLGIQFATLMAFYVYYLVTGTPLRPSWGILLFPLLVAWLAAFGTGFGLIISSLTTKYRDLRQLVNFGFSLWMYATPIVYPLDQVPREYAWVFYLNPVTAPVELFRVYFYGKGQLPASMILSSIVTTVVVLFVGLVLFNRNERTFIDVA